MLYFFPNNTVLNFAYLGTFKINAFRRWNVVRNYRIVTILEHWRVNYALSKVIQSQLKATTATAASATPQVLHGKPPA